VVYGAAKAVWVFKPRFGASFGHFSSSFHMSASTYSAALQGVESSG